MIRKQRSIIALLIILFLYCLLLMLSCGGPESENSGDNNPTENNSNDSNEDNNNDGNEDNTDLSYVGYWQIQEDLTGCEQTGTKSYRVEIIQNEKEGRYTHTLMQMDDEFIFDCEVIGDKLLCNGDIPYENGDRYNYWDYDLWFINSNELVGEGNWVFYPHNGYACGDGHSVLEATRITNAEDSGN